MSSQTPLDTETVEAPEITAEQVADYLSRHPGFFDDHPALLASLRIPHASGGAVSLIERQVEILRSQTQSYKRKLLELVEIGRANEALHGHMHRLTVALMRCGSLGEAVGVLHEHLKGDFRAQAVGLRLSRLPKGFEDPRVRPFDRDDPAFEPFAGFLKNIRPVCGRLQPDQLAYLFGDESGTVGSAALVPLGERLEYGLLAIGNADADYYHPAMDTHVLQNLSDLVTCTLHPWLQETD